MGYSGRQRPEAGRRGGKTVQTFAIGLPWVAWFGLCKIANQWQTKWIKIQTMSSCAHLASKPILLNSQPAANQLFVIQTCMQTYANPTCKPMQTHIRNSKPLSGIQNPGQYYCCVSSLRHHRSLCVSIHSSFKKACWSSTSALSCERQHWQAPEVVAEQPSLSWP